MLAKKQFSAASQLLHTDIFKEGGSNGIRDHSNNSGPEKSETKTIDIKDKDNNAVMTIKPENKSTQSVVEIEEGSTPPTTPEAAVLAKTSIKASIRIPSLAIITYGLVLAPVFSQILCPLPIYTRDEPRTVPLRPTNTLDDSLMTAQVPTTTKYLE